MNELLCLRLQCACPSPPLPPACRQPLGTLPDSCPQSGQLAILGRSVVCGQAFCLLGWFSGGGRGVWLCPPLEIFQRVAVCATCRLPWVSLSTVHLLGWPPSLHALATCAYALSVSPLSWPCAGPQGCRPVTVSNVSDVVTSGHPFGVLCSTLACCAPHFLFTLWGTGGQDFSPGYNLEGIVTGVARWHLW